VIIGLASTYNSQANPRLGNVDQQRILTPALGSLNFLKGEIGPVLLEVDLDDEGDTKIQTDCQINALRYIAVYLRRGNSRLEVTLVLGQQRQRLLAVVLGLEHGSSKDLHGVVFGVVLCEFLCELQGSVCLAGGLQGQGPDGRQVGAVLLDGGLGEAFVELTKGNLGAESEDLGRELVLRGERGGLEVDHTLVLARVEGAVDVEELCGEAKLARVGAVETNGRPTTLCRKGIHFGCCGRIGSREMGVVDDALWPQLFTVSLSWRGNSAEITRGRWADRLQSIHFHRRHYINDTPFTNL
jgi:hypothetical protein